MTLGPVYERCFRALGYGFRVRSDVEDAESVLDRLFGPFSSPGSADGQPVYALMRRDLRGNDPDDASIYELFLDGDSIQRVANAGSMVDWLVADVTRRAMEEEDEHVAVHAGVVGLGSRVVVLPAPPDAGKTTLVAALTRAGFTFLSDEVAPIRPEDLWVLPFPRPILMDPPSMLVLDGLRDSLPAEYERFRLSRYHLAVEDLRPGVLGQPSPVAAVICPRYVAGSSTVLEPISRAEGLMALADQSFNLQRLGRKGFDTLVSLVRDVPSYRLTIGDLPTAVDLVGSVLTA